MVHILTPPPLHHEIAMQCLAAGLHVFIEKPIATSAVQAVDLVAAAEKAGRRIGICHNFLGILLAYVRLKSLRDLVVWPDLKCRDQLVLPAFSAALGSFRAVDAA